MMPQMDGWAVCRRIREMTDVPVIMLTSLDQEDEMVRGLDLGADDFVSKPISPKHLIARVRAVLRRARTPETSRNDFRYDDGVLAIDVVIACGPPQRRRDRPLANGVSPARDSDRGAGPRSFILLASETDLGP